MMTLIEANQRITIRYEIEFDCLWSHETTWFRYEFWYLDSTCSQRDLLHRINICDLLLKHEENESFLKRIVTGDEKWIVYDNVKRKRSSSSRDEPAQSISKANIHEKKVIFFVWWDLN